MTAFSADRVHVIASNSPVLGGMVIPLLPNGQDSERLRAFTIDLLKEVWLCCGNVLRSSLAVSLVLLPLGRKSILMDSICKSFSIKASSSCYSGEGGFS